MDHESRHHHPSFAEDRDESRDFTQASAAVVLVAKISMLKCTKTRKKMEPL